MTPKEINSYIAERIAWYMPKVKFFRGQSWFSDGGKMYLISDKLSLTDKFRTSYVIMKCVLSCMEFAENTEIYNYIVHQPNTIDAEDFILKVIAKIIENDQKLAAEKFEKFGFFGKKEENVSKIGCWLMPSKFCIDYQNAEMIPVSEEISCFDKIFFEGKLDGIFKPEPPKNFKTLCHNVFGVQTDEEYYHLLGLIAKSFKSIPGDQSIIVVKGKGGSGKSTWVSVMTKIFNELIVEITEEVFNPRSAAYDFTSQKRAMANAHIILIDESSDKAKDNTLLKRITSGTTIPYRELQTNGGTLHVAASVVYFSNTDVDLSNIDSGTLRRLFEFKSPDETINIEWKKGKFDEIFMKEKDGIINDFFTAMKLFVEKPKKERKASEMVATSLNDLFFNENFAFDENTAILKQTFLDICRKSREFSGTKKRAQLIGWLEERGVKYGYQGRDGKYYVKGIKII